MLTAKQKVDVHQLGMCVGVRIRVRVRVRRISVVLDMVFLRPIFDTCTTHIVSGYA